LPLAEATPPVAGALSTCSSFCGAGSPFQLSSKAFRVRVGWAFREAQAGPDLPMFARNRGKILMLLGS